MKSLVTVHDQSMSGIVGRNTDGDLVSHHNTDIETTHLSTKLRLNLDIVLELHFINAPRKGIHYFAVNLSQIVFRHWEEFYVTRRSEANQIFWFGL